MIDYRYDNHTVLIFGKGKHREVGEEIKKYGSKAMIVSYGRPYEKPILQDVEESLEKAGIEWVEFTGVRPNPIMEPVIEGADIVKREKIDFLLAVGGGSVIDTAKAIAAGALHNGNIARLWSGEETFAEVLPVGAIVTCPATGSESSSTSTITEPESGVKMGLVDDRLRPVFAILNPELTYTLPPYQTFCGITDIISHAMERYFSKTSDTNLVDRMGEALMRTCMEAAMVILRDPENYAARSEIMLAAPLAHNDMLGIGKEADCVSHAVGIAISSYNDTAHGATLSVIIPAYMKFVYKDNLKLFAAFAANVMGVYMDVNDMEATALEGIRRLEDFYKAIGMPTRLSEIGIDGTDEALLDKLSELSQIQMQGHVWGSLVKATPDNCRQILRLAV